MLTRGEVDPQVQATAPSRHSRLHAWLARRSRQLARALLILATGLGLVAIGVVLKRATCLIGLPDIGDPFDVAAFRALQIPNHQDAFVLIRQAAAKLGPTPSLSAAARRVGVDAGWSQADPKLRAWVQANREALDLFRQGSDRPDGILHLAAEPYSSSYIVQWHFGPLVWLALLEGSRLAEQGDMAGAWSWYRAVLRLKTHVMRRGGAFERFLIDRASSGLHKHLADWAADSRTELPLLRRALEEVKATEPKPEWDSFSLKVDYLSFMSELDRPDGFAQQGDEEDRAFLIGSEPLAPNLVWSLHAARRFLANEPERSRRVLRLAFANWLAHVEEADPQRRRPAIRATFHSNKHDTSLFFYDADPGAPAGSRRRSARELSNWLMTTHDAKPLLLQWPWPSLRSSEQREHFALAVLLAEELCYREKGTRPASDQALVGPYLDHLPDDGLNESDDGSTPLVLDPRIEALGNSE
jgi:hypothetical protein